MNLGNIFNFVYNGEQKAENAGTLLVSNMLIKIIQTK